MQEARRGATWCSVALLIRCRPSSILLRTNRCSDAWLGTLHISGVFCQRWTALIWLHHRIIRCCNLGRITILRCWLSSIDYWRWVRLIRATCVLCSVSLRNWLRKIACGRLDCIRCRCLGYWTSVDCIIWNISRSCKVSGILRNVVWGSTILIVGNYSVATANVSVNLDGAYTLKIRSSYLISLKC